MSDTKAKEETVTLSAAQYRDVMERLSAMESAESKRNVAETSGNPIIAKTCNSCGKPVDEKTGACLTHPSEHVNHIAMGLDIETGLRRPVIKNQTRNA